ncbi:PREDICTED: protein takeout-like [Dinoponera quadriceps]|uniref:Protein takeout-like n=1 Tax=Dinoponera quadriceps TaxID=609295 RepID=A0A6P3YE73_DINQU|nr:PREDICTED: protein takeout-like [Dinoponera quadriceps]
MEEEIGNSNSNNNNNNNRDWKQQIEICIKILPIEPLTIDYMRINSSGPVSLTQEYRNMKIYGLTKNVQVFTKNFNVNTFALNVVAVTSQLNVTYNTTMTFDAEYERYKRHGESYLKLKKLNFHIKDTDMKIYFENLFGKVSSLGEDMNRLLNENSKTIFQEVKPALEEIFKQVITGIAVKIYSNVPLNKIYPPE